MKRMNRQDRGALLLAAAFLAAVFPAAAAQPPGYLQLPAPVTLAMPAQAWEGDQQPHTLSVLELNRDGYRYWGWYGLNHGRGMGLARSNDLLHWVKSSDNPVWRNARWPSALRSSDAQGQDILYFAVTRDYDTPRSRIVLASSTDGMHLTELKTLVSPQSQPRNQNPNLIKDPLSGRYVLTFYRGNDTDYFDIVSRSAGSVPDLDKAPENVLIHSTQTIAAPTLLHLPAGGPGGGPIYYLATEIYPNRYDTAREGDWQVSVFWSANLAGPFKPVSGNPVQRGDRACLFQHVFDGVYYGYQSHLDRKTDRWDMEVLTVRLAE